MAEKKKLCRLLARACAAPPRAQAAAHRDTNAAFWKCAAAHYAQRALLCVQTCATVAQEVSARKQRVARAMRPASCHLSLLQGNGSGGQQSAHDIETKMAGPSEERTRFILLADDD